MTATDTRVVDAPDDQARIDRFLRDQRLDRGSPTIVPLTGDASDRKYFRVILGDGTSIVLALHAGPIEFSALPFANVAALLRQMPLPVPAILGHADADGIIALQDLGDVTLQARLAEAAPDEHAALYREAVSMIALMQRRGDELASEHHLPYRLAFDTEKLTWELDFFTSHFLEGLRGTALSNSERTALREEWHVIAGELSAEPRVLCHRDYHSRNLMLVAGALHVIDFQDARLGPDTYDLASLLRDSYVETTDRQRDDLIGHFLVLKGVSDTAEFRRRFDLMALQRNLKALGTFGYQATARANRAYAQYVPRTLGYARMSLEKYPRFARLREVLAEHLDELR